MQDAPLSAIDVVHRVSLRGCGFFTSWLPRYVSQLQSLTVQAAPKHPQPTAHAAAFTRGAAARVAGALAAAATDPTRLQLQQYSSNIIISSGILSALPAASLTKLSFQLGFETAADRSALSPPLGQLTNLVELHIAATGYDVFITHNVMLGIRQLHQLTRLELRQLQLDTDLQLLPTQLQQLTLVLGNSHDFALNWSSEVMPDLGHLAKLQQLDLTAWAKPADGSFLPTQLRQLQLSTCGNDSDIGAFDLTSLQDLRQLTILQSIDGRHRLGTLSSLSALEQVALGYAEMADAAYASRGWKAVPQLCELQFNFMSGSQEDVWLLLEVVSQQTQITRLEVSVGPLTVFGDVVIEDSEGTYHEQDSEETGLCAHLAKLVNLKDLALHFNSEDMRLRASDIRHLTSLTGLTRVDVSHVGYSLISLETVVGLADKLKVL